MSTYINNPVPERLVPGTEAWQTYEHEHKQRYAYFAPRCRNLAVLDAACGVGYGSAMLAKAGAALVMGVDISLDAVEYACQHFTQSNLQFSHCDVEQLALFNRSFDIAISFETIEHLRNPRMFLSQIRSILRPGGIFICSTPNKAFFDRGMAFNPHHLNEMTFDEFSAIFSEFFDIEERYFQSHSEAYRRHIQILKELDQLIKPIRFSLALRLENWFRRTLRREYWVTLPLSSNLSRAVSGDYIIEPMDQPLDSHLTFILVGRVKN